jgi:glycosyltransferase involved in cell wall biosynthesis
MHGAPEHHAPWYQIHKRIIQLLDWFCGRYLQHRIIAVSHDLAKILQNDYPANRIEVIENGIDLELIAKPVKKPESDKEKSQVDIGIAGRLVPVKRVDVFIRTAATLLNDHPELNVIFHIFGDGPLRMELEELADKLMVKNRVSFEGHCENMQQALQHLDILLITSDHEGLPMILLEAMAAKVAVIAHAVGGISTVLNQGGCGTLVSVQDPSAYADAINKLINNSGHRAGMTQKALNRVTTVYSNEKNASFYHTVYMNIISG